ncbi:MAG TPA: hypothetical protein ENI74_09570 [Gammaproteobacteria bacterium]|nr:hypothetical protein [Gammaproteobacteria bacterium]
MRRESHKGVGSRSYLHHTTRDTASFYHGTDEESAWSVMSRGFRLDNERWGRGWGNGVYLSGTDDFASTWGQIIICCRLQTGTRLLWHKDYARKVIDSLRREFGKAILSPEFWKVLPRNKQFTRSEVIQLWHYLVTRYYESPRRFRIGRFERLQKNYSRIYEQLRRHGYDGVGFHDSDWPEILIFNPARVQPVSAHRWCHITHHLGAPIPVGRLKLMHAKTVRGLISDP